MEAGFGQDFSAVRLHVGERAERATNELNARAFTVGRDIWFGRNQLAPATPSGQRLLAHELAHVVQQGAGTPAGALVQRAACPKDCVEPVSKGELCTAKEVERPCATRGSADLKNRITHIRVVPGTSRVELFVNGEPGTRQGKKESHPCTLNAAETPVPFKGGKCLVVGQKCGERHTTFRKASGKIFRMAFFTEFGGTSMAFGFHDSQRVAPGARSAGCVRVSCEIAKKISLHAASGLTTIELAGVTDLSSCSRKKRKKATTGGSGGAGGSART
jgi:hypothetical protein